MRLLICIWTLLLTISCNPWDNSESIIKEEFERWKIKQIDKGLFLEKKNCNPDSVIKKESKIYWAFPDQINFKFADINNDGTRDGLVTFIPDQCDGGNGSTWTQLQILILSKREGFTTIDNFFENIKTTGKGFYHLDSITTNQFLGTYYEFKEDDPHCCPSIKRPVAISFDTKEVRDN